jgi:phosphomannomutase/phosphoglucomutase
VLKDALIKGLIEKGMHIRYIGMVPTPLLYFSVHELKLDGAVMITGSHNPPEYNGFKVCLGKTTIYGEEIQKLRQ